MTTARLAFDQITCVRGDRLLFDALSFTLGPGDAAIVTGPNGVGKSSLLRIAAGLLRPIAGTVRYEGGIAYLGEQAALDTHLPLARALGFWASIDGFTEEGVAQALAAMDITALAEIPVRMLSSGQRRRAGLARVMLGRASVWLLDEPGNGLDEAALDRLAEAIVRHRQNGGIVMAATHQPLGVDDALALDLTS